MRNWEWERKENIDGNEGGERRVRGRKEKWYKVKVEGQKKGRKEKEWNGRNRESKQEMREGWDEEENWIQKK